ncbi:NUDIX domain-containing protein [Novosphingobium sp. fls2-241-R2A-195]|uniref:NUDIX hydrolase n=1 Tax=Novosphingobium sp. fls2-241-R2A-195 TaxID=3040296 RepID=UPI003305ECE9
MSGKACAVPFRYGPHEIEVLAFRHPLAGNQFVKGTIEASERPEAAATRELYEESGLQLTASPIFLGSSTIGLPPLQWHFYAFRSSDLPDHWDHQTEDGGGLTFSFFWQPVRGDLDNKWHLVFHDAFQLIKASLQRTLR